MDDDALTIFIRAWPATADAVSRFVEDLVHNLVSRNDNKWINFTRRLVMFSVALWVLCIVVQTMDAGCPSGGLVDIAADPKVWKELEAKNFTISFDEILDYVDWTNYQCWPRNCYRYSWVNMVRGASWMLTPSNSKVDL